MEFNGTLRVRLVSLLVLVAGLGVAGAGLLYGLPLANDGLDSAQAMYAAEGIELNYNAEGQLIDVGSVEEAQAILNLLENEYKYPLNHDNLDPNDPLVNTRDELMVQYAIITYHVMHGQASVTLTQEQVPITYRGVTYTEPGEYQIQVGAYYAELDRTHPIERQLRAAWSPLALSLNGLLAGAHANQSAGELAQMTSLGMGGVGLLFALLGAGGLWVSYAPKHKQA